jgi:hypothetical protein
VRLLHEIHRYYEESPRGRRKYYPMRRRHGALARITKAPLQLLVLVAMGAAIAQFIPTLWCMLMQFTSVIAIGAVVFFCYKLFSRR